MVFKLQDDIEVFFYGLFIDSKVNIFVIGVGIEYSLGQLREIFLDFDGSFVVIYIIGENFVVVISFFKEMLVKGIYYYFFL